MMAESAEPRPEVQTPLGFVEAANPHQWLLVADNLHRQAAATRRRFGADTMDLPPHRPGTQRWPMGWCQPRRVPTGGICAREFDQGVPGM